MSTPDALTTDYIASRWPRLFHMTEAGSWPSVQRHGLLSTSALLDLFEVAERERGALESARRPETVKITHPAHGTAWIRDNKPINETVLRRTLVGMSEVQWYRTLNARVFFWLSQKRLDGLLRSPSYRDRTHDILTLDTKALLQAHGDHTELAHLNSGAVHPGANYPRGAGTFCTIGEYPWRERVRVARAQPIVELTVPWAVPDAADFVIDVTRG
jgi:hypothetical protein